MVVMGPLASASPTPDSSAISKVELSLASSTLLSSLAPTPEHSAQPTTAPELSSLHSTTLPATSTTAPSDLPTAVQSDAAVVATPVPTPPLSIISTSTPPQSPDETGDILPTFVTVLPELKFTLLETPDGLSESGLSDATSGIEQFLGSILNQIYNVDGRSLSDYYADINLVAVDKTTTLQDLPSNELVRHLRQSRRQIEKVRGTEIICNGTVSFFDLAPSSSRVAKTVIALSTHFNDYLVTNITDTGNPELASVYVVYAEKYETEVEENYLPGWINENEDVEENLPEETKIEMIIMTAAGVATVTMLLLVFTSWRQRERSSRNQTTFEVATSFPITTRTDQSLVSSLTEVCTNVYDDNILIVHRSDVKNRGKDENVSSVMRESSSFTEVCANVYDDNILQVHRNNVDNSSQDKNVSSAVRDSLMSAAEINCRGTFSLGKDDDSVLPKSWLKALHADENSNASLVTTESAYQHQILESDTNVSSRDPSEHGCVDFSNIPISPKLLCTDNLYAVASSDSDIELADSKKGGFPTFGRDHASNVSVDDMSSSSSDTGKGTKRSASTVVTSQLIRDLIWLESKISMENAAKADLDELEKRVSATNAEDTGPTDAKESEALSVACRDCVIPSGIDIIDGIDLETTPDGPTITRVADESRLQGHLLPGNRIVAIDGIDTKDAPADLVASLLTSTTSPTHKVTVLQFGSSDV